MERLALKVSDLVTIIVPKTQGTLGSYLKENDKVSVEEIDRPNDCGNASSILRIYISGAADGRERGPRRAKGKAPKTPTRTNAPD